MKKRRPMKEIKPGACGFLAAALLVTSLAAAPFPAGDDTGIQASAPANAKLLGLPKEKTAFTLSLAGTVASWSLMVFIWAGATADEPSEFASALGIAAVPGIMVGPSLGSFYGGCWGRGLLLTGLRLGASVAAIAYQMENDEADNTAVWALWLGTLIGSAIYECATVKSAVRKHNAARLAKRGLKLGVSPVAVRKGAGLNVWLSF